MTKTTIIRCIFTIMLLIPVYRNSHWSVAISLTLIFIAIELIVNKLNKE